jgi:hypothetical protein
VIGNDFLEKLNPLVPYEQFALHHNTLQGIHSLTIWFVDPEIDPQATADTLAQNLELAVQHAAEAAHILRNADDCAKTEFTIINPIVVDSNYVEWYAGAIPPAFVPSTPELSDTQREEMIALFRDDYRISAPPPPLAPPPEGSCTWPETEAKIREHLADPRLNNVFFFIRDPNGNAVWTQWYISSTAQPIIQATPPLVSILEQMDCLYPRPDIVYAIVLGPTNETLIYGYLLRASDQVGMDETGINGFDFLQFRYVEDP